MKLALPDSHSELRMHPQVIRSKPDPLAIIADGPDSSFLSKLLSGQNTTEQDDSIYRMGSQKFATATCVPPSSGS